MAVARPATRLRMTEREAQAQDARLTELIGELVLAATATGAARDTATMQKRRADVVAHCAALHEYIASIRVPAPGAAPAVPPNAPFRVERPDERADAEGWGIVAADGRFVCEVGTMVGPHEIAELLNAGYAAMRAAPAVPPPDASPMTPKCLAISERGEPCGLVEGHAGYHIPGHLLVDRRGFIAPPPAAHPDALRVAAERLSNRLDCIEWCPYCGYTGPVRCPGTAVHKPDCPLIGLRAALAAAPESTP